MSGRARHSCVLAGVLLALCFTACGNSAPPPRDPESNVISGEVLDRSPGHAERPDWADESQPISRAGQSLRVAGYVAIPASKRRDAGELVADSYAKAELLRFLASRVKAILKDRLSTEQAATTVEKITERAGGWVASIPVSERYWEKRRDESGEQWHLWSRVDLSQQQVDELLRSVLDQSADLASPIGTLRQEVSQDWDKLADPSTWEKSRELPEGTFVPAWAKSGDQKTAQEFRFVCHGLGADEKSARAEAQASCSEKLCKLFGVEIRAETKVVENLEGLSAESQVTERCPEVRAVGRETKMHTGECGPSGCVFWQLQTYPLAMYEAEKQRLEQPTIVRQQVVIQEGDQVFKDPQKCADALTAYGSVQGLDARSFEVRTKHLDTALIACQGIDGRDSGLFESLNLALTRPLDGLRENDESPPTVAFDFLAMGPAFSDRLTAERFLTGRIQLVRNLVAGAVLPMQLAELGKPTVAELDRLLAKFIELPVKDDPLSPHHLYNLHDFVLAKMLEDADMPYSKLLRDFVLQVAEGGEYSCGSYGGKGAARPIRYLRKDPDFNQRSWNAIASILKAAKGYSVQMCISAAFGKERAPTSVQVDQVAELAVEDAWHGAEEYVVLAKLLETLPLGEQLRVYRKYGPRLDGGDTGQKRVRDTIQYYAFQFDPRDREHCSTWAERIRILAQNFPEFDVDRHLPCRCLAKSAGLSAAERRELIAELAIHSKKRACDEARESDWPGGFYAPPKMSRLDSGDSSPLGYAEWSLDDQVKSCLKAEADFFPTRPLVRIIAKASQGRLEAARVQAMLQDSSDSLRRSGDHPGYVSKVDVERVLEQARRCVEVKLPSARIPAKAPATQEAAARTITIEYDSGSRRSSYGEHPLY
jgi:hypothetical protein